MHVDAAIVFSGLVNGSIYGLVGLGMTIVFAATRILNFAQGEFLMVGAMVSYSVEVVLRQPVFVSIVVVAVAMVVLALVMEYLVLLPVRASGSPVAWILSTIAVSIFVSEAFAIPYGRDLLRPPEALPQTAFRLGEVPILWQEVMIIVVAIAITVAYELFLSRTMFGRAVRATAHDAEVAGLMGINTRRVVRASFIIGGILTGIAGVLVAPITFAQTSMGVGWMLKGFIASLMGGLGSVRGALVGGLLLGVFGSVVANNLQPGWADAVIYALLALLLVFRPTGLFARPAAH